MELNDAYRPFETRVNASQVWNILFTRDLYSIAAEGTATRERPYVVMLDVRPGVPASGKPPVRIFLGTQDEQGRAERIFFYSIFAVLAAIVITLFIPEIPLRRTQTPAAGGAA